MFHNANKKASCLVSREHTPTLNLTGQEEKQVGLHRDSNLESLLTSIFRLDKIQFHLVCLVKNSLRLNVGSFIKFHAEVRVGNIFV